MQQLRDKILKNQLTIGSWINIGNTTIAEIMSDVGFEWLVIDMEHSAISISMCQEMIRVIDLKGVTPIVRVGENNPLIIKRVLDAGAKGIIVPMVNTRQEAEEAVKSVKYPPFGNRGVGISRAQNYGRKFKEYYESNNSESIVIVQIEHIKAVKNLESILSVNGVDAFIVGPYDLSGSIGIPGKFDAPKFIEIIKKINEIAKNTKTTSGYHIVNPEVDYVKEKIESGYTFLAYGVDFMFLQNKCLSDLEKTNKILKDVQLQMKRKE
jgi:2-keto-3-deoxy-L-rhamnonate aldolase RhmA